MELDQRCAASPPPRCSFDGVLDVELCSELISIHKSVGVIGYRPGVRSTTLHDIVTAAPDLLVPLVDVRQRVWQLVEGGLGMECELFVEFTGLMSWSRGASIGWHHDSNRGYLEQRDVTAVLYLNTQGDGFEGGNFLYHDGTTVVPQAGKLIAYTAGEENTHMVEPVLSGERFTLTMWFTRNPQHQEDAKVIKSLLQLPSPLAPPGMPSTMYLLPDGSDLRLARLAGLGFHLVGWQAKQTGHTMTTTQGDGCEDERQCRQNGQCEQDGRGLQGQRGGEQGGQQALDWGPPASLDLQAELQGQMQLQDQQQQQQHVQQPGSPSHPAAAMQPPDDCDGEDAMGYLFESGSSSGDEDGDGRCGRQSGSEERQGDGAACSTPSTNPKQLNPAAPDDDRRSKRPRQHECTVAVASGLMLQGLPGQQQLQHESYGGPLASGSTAPVAAQPDVAAAATAVAAVSGDASAGGAEFGNACSSGGHRHGGGGDDVPVVLAFMHHSDHAGGCCDGAAAANHDDGRGAAVHGSSSSPPLPLLTLQLPDPPTASACLHWLEHEWRVVHGDRQAAAASACGFSGSAAEQGSNSASFGEWLMHLAGSSALPCHTAHAGCISEAGLRRNQDDGVQQEGQQQGPAPHAGCAPAAAGAALLRHWQRVCVEPRRQQLARLLAQWRAARVLLPIDDAP